MEDIEGEDISLASLLSKEYSDNKTEGYSESSASKVEKFDKSKLKKLQVLIDQSKAFSQIISSSLVQQTAGKNADDNDDDDTKEPLKKKQKTTDNLETNTKVLDTYGQPKSLVGVTLKEHQIHGMNWLISMYENGLNGILADEMGLGKTVQTISLLCFLLEQGIQGPFLIVSPLSVVSNWCSELSSFAPKLSYVSYVGSKDHRQKLRRKSLRKFNVVVTSYEISLIDFPYLKNISWSYLVVDEGHRLKNANCMLFSKLKSLNVSNRLLLTGTPLQNNLAELWSLLNFILPDVFHDFATFQSYFNFSEFENLANETNPSDRESKEAFSSLVSMEIRKALVDNLHTILKPFILRRLKKDVLRLPPKREYIIYSSLSPLQSTLYSQLLDSQVNFRGILLETFFPLYIKYNFPKLLKYADSYLGYRKDEKTDFYWDAPTAASLSEHYDFVQSQLRVKRISNPLMQLRQLCDSPYHYFFPWNDDTKLNYDLILNTSKLQSLDSLIPRLLKDNPNQKILLFSQFKSTIDLLRAYFEEHPNSKHGKSSVFPVKTCTITGSSSKLERDEAVETFTNDPEHKVFLLSTRAANLGLNLTAATTVILYDSDLNPMVDIQAIARVHRIGQKNPCIVYRLATRATVEEAIWERVIKKRVLEGIVIETGEFNGSDAWKTHSNKKTPRKESVLSSLLNFYSSKTSNSTLNNFKDPKLRDSCLESNELNEEELNEITSHDLEKYKDNRVLDEVNMHHIKLLSETDITGQNGLDGGIM
ncbi:hypothetical protein CAS74_003096 [Pichia kudriavzevii]|uniref:Uncharacterized protein n=1 Tax=Pichia kudriavzevii TaxID=4909 RepID=A0A099P4V7_PICKU|nr:hypothetical protein JL09_g841 [Pichia kudriavzevii]OUT22107.1 hypothetical protein CAS74_003096 [Pichia kudriavzevii]